jgi:hypothetical protein
MLRVIPPPLKVQHSPSVIHPVYRIEVRDPEHNQWIDLDRWTSLK